MMGVMGNIRGSGGIGARGNEVGTAQGPQGLELMEAVASRVAERVRERDDELQRLSPRVLAR